MSYIPNIKDYLEISVVKILKFFECFKSTKKELYSKLDEKNLRKVDELFFTFPTALDGIDKYAELADKTEPRIHEHTCLSDYCVWYYYIKILLVLILINPESELINTKSVVKNKLKYLLDQLKMFKTQTTLVLWYKEIFDHETIYRICHSNTKLITHDLDANKAFESVHQSVMTKIETFVSKDWIFKAIIENCINVLLEN